MADLSLSPRHPRQYIRGRELEANCKPVDRVLVNESLMRVASDVVHAICFKSLFLWMSLSQKLTAVTLLPSSIFRGALHASR
jgi:hypothetical protein